MTKDRGLIVMPVGVMLLAGVLAGCRGDARSEVAKATEKARRLYDRACAELKDPVFKVGEKFVPVMPDMNSADGNDITLLPAGAINPQVDGVLDEALSTMTAAMGSEAPAADKALAHAMLARIHALVGYRHALEAGLRRQEARDLLGRMENAAIHMADHGKRIANCDALLSVADPTVDEMTARAQASAQTAATQIAELKGKIAELEKEKASLQAASEKLLEDARKFRVDSQLAEPIKGIALFDKAREKEDKAAANAVRLTEIEDTIAFLNSKIAVLELDQKAAKNKSDAAAEIRKLRAERKAETEKQRAEFVKLLTAEQQLVGQLAEKALAACKAAAALEAKAVEAYGRADAEYEQYASATRPGGAVPTDPAVVALHGDMRMERASLYLRASALQDRLDQVVKEVTALWSGLPVQNTPAPVIASLAEYHSADRDKLAQQAKDDLRWAAKNYEKARDSRGVGRQQQWAYQLQVAAAYAYLYRLTGDSGDRDSAGKALDALEEVKDSRFVARDFRHFRQLLAAAPGGGGAPAPSAP